MIDSNMFDRLLKSIATVENRTNNKCDMICGDFNSRTSTNPDFVIDGNPGHMNALPDDYIPDSSTPCCSENKGHVNNNGLLLFDLCKQTSL